MENSNFDMKLNIPVLCGEEQTTKINKVNRHLKLEETFENDCKELDKLIKETPSFDNDLFIDFDDLDTTEKSLLELKFNINYMLYIIKKSRKIKETGNELKNFKD